MRPHTLVIRLLLYAVLIGMVGACRTDEAAPQPSAAPPNVVMILVDDQGWGDLSLNGNTNVSTPNIDRLAQQGAQFNHFYVSPVCSPTRAEMLTGRYHPRSGVTATSAGKERLDLDETTLAEVFKEAGYATAAFGKWHNGIQPPYHPNARGFDEFYGFCSGHWGNYFSPPLEHNGQLVQGNGYVIDDFTDRALEFIEAHRDQPFLVYLPYNTPHSPMQVPDQWWQKFAENPLEMRHREPEKENIQHTRAALAMSENIDWNVGRILERLQSLALDDNTIVIYFSDNGPNGWRWNGGMKGRKGSTDEGGVRSPFLIRWPDRIAPDTQINTIAAAIDLLPTLADLAGIDFRIDKPLDGVSLKPLLQGGEQGWTERLLFNHWRGRTSVRSQQYRLDNEDHLFDMVNDPGQAVDIASQQPEMARELMDAKAAWAADVLAEVADEDTRSFPIGHPDYRFTQLPARDGVAQGRIQRSNRYPNDSFFTNWTSLDDAITWNVDVLADGDFEVVLYYTCPEDAVGATVELRLGESTLTGQITEAHDPPLTGMEQDRVERIESYVKDFKPMTLGTISLKQGPGTLSLKALDIPGPQVMDFRLMMLRRVDS